MTRLLPPAAVLAVGLLVGPARPQPPAAGRDPLRFTPVKFHGTVMGNKDVSAAAAVGDYLVVGSDETAGVQVLAKDGDGYRVVRDVPLGDPGTEVDIEAVAADGDTVYVAGSHCRVRSIGKKGGGGVGGVGRKESREQVFRFRLGPDGRPGPVAKTSLTPALERHPVLGPFLPVASKENGVDVEGLAVKDGRLVFGFRGPVLRDNWVPILSCSFDDPSGTAKVAYVQLDGRGVRDLAAVPGGFLVVAGPVGDGDTSYRIVFWDGTDGLAADAPARRPAVLAELPGFRVDGRDGKPEGLAVLGMAGRECDLLLVCDGLIDGGPVRFRLPLP